MTKKERKIKMKQWMALLLALLIASLPCALAEDTNEYRDEIYAFRYPAAWSCETAANGDIVLGSPDGQSAVLTFSIITDLVSFAGDAETDAPAIESMIAGYSGKNLALSGAYDLIQSGALYGFRAYGAWRTGNLDAVMVVLTGDRHMVSFVLVGAQAIALEQDFLASLELLGDAPTEGEEGFLRWEGTQFSLDYPDHYGVMEQSTGVVFLNPADANSIIMARAYALDFEYSDGAAQSIAATALPKSTKVEPNPEMVTIGGKNAAVIKGAVSGGPMAFYVIGGGRTAIALMFTGEEACGMAEHVIQSVEIK